MDEISEFICKEWSEVCVARPSSRETPARVRAALRTLTRVLALRRLCALQVTMDDIKTVDKEKK